MEAAVLRHLLAAIIELFGSKSVGDLENLVYQTAPMRKYVSLMRSGLKPEKGAYVLDGSGIRMQDHRNEINEGRLLALRHSEKYPNINLEQQKRLVEELGYLEQLRPNYPDADRNTTTA